MGTTVQLLLDSQFGHMHPCKPGLIAMQTTPANFLGEVLYLVGLN